MAVVLAFLAGCSTGLRQMPPDVDLTPPPTLAMVAKPKAAKPTKAAPPAPVMPIPTNRVEVVESWVSLEQFCETNGFGPPRRQLTPDSVEYSFVTSRGTMTFKMGSKMAVWRGTDFDLGYAPELQGGHPYVYSLDVRKNLQPLLDDAARTNVIHLNHTIVIDPGHGGTDTGAKNVFNGHFEKEYTLDLAEQLKTLLTQAGWTVWLTRTNDVYLQLSNRVAFAEARKADLFISLHYNSAYPDEEEAGLETYCLTPKGLPSNLTRGYRDDPSLSFPNNNFDEENMELAFALHRAVLKVNGHTDRGVRRARFLGVLQNQNRPAILMEGGYLSNPREAKRIADPAYREHVAEALAEALNVETGSQTNGVTSAQAGPPATNHSAVATNQMETNQPVQTNSMEGQSE